MKTKSGFFTLLTLVLTVSLQVTAQSHDHHSHESEPMHTSEEGDSGVGKFQADETLKPKMEFILKAAKSLHEKGIQKASVVEVGATIEGTVNEIFKTCKLEPKADAAIHPILADLLKGAAKLKAGKQKQGQEIVHKALQSYTKRFEHEGWGL